MWVGHLPYIVWIIPFSLDEHVRLISKEIQVDFSRSMNRITFDKIVSRTPEKYPFVTLPQEEEKVVPERGVFNNNIVIIIACILCYNCTAVWAIMNLRYDFKATFWVTCLVCPT